ncbi:MAG TPA: PAS domain S-box protein, partial [Candidatus Wallbacteria bacterium]|nr:PAS domain S-box protein [Candidatus Wallbacteria bacterium]
MKTAVKILVVAHSDENISLVKKALESLKRYDFEISEALSYANALEKLSSSDNYCFCFIFNDVVSLDGLKLIKIPGKNNARCRFVFITSEKSEDAEIDYLKSAICDQLSVNEISPALVERIIRYNMPPAACSERLADLKYRSLIKDAPFGIVYHDRSGNIIFINDELLKMFGYKYESEVIKINVLTYNYFVEQGISSDLRKCMEMGIEDVFERPYA